MDDPTSIINKIKEQKRFYKNKDGTDKLDDKGKKIEKPPLAESTIKSYTGILKKVKDIVNESYKKKLDFNNLSWLKNWKRVVELFKNKKLSDSTIKSYYNVIYVTLDATGGDAGLKNKYGQLRDELNKKYLEEQSTGIISDKQKPNFISEEIFNKSIDDFMKSVVEPTSESLPFKDWDTYFTTRKVIKGASPLDYSIIQSTTGLRIGRDNFGDDGVTSQYQLKKGKTWRDIQTLVFLKLYSLYPVRNELSNFTKISAETYDNAGLSENTDTNWAVIMSNTTGNFVSSGRYIEGYRLVVNNYKTKNKYGKYVINIEPKNKGDKTTKEMMYLIALMMKAQRDHFKDKEYDDDKLFLNDKGQALSKNNLSQLLLRWSGKVDWSKYGIDGSPKISTTMIRKIYASELSAEKNEKAKKLAGKMKHSVGTHNLVYVKKAGGGDGNTD